MLQFLRFVAVRAALAVFTLTVVSFIVFSLMELVPGNCAERYIAYKNTQGSIVTQADINAEIVRMGLDKPYVIRWVNWVSGVFIRGDFGDSCLWRVPVTQLVGEKFLLSLTIAMSALVITYLIAIPIGIASANLRGGALDNSLRIVSYLGLALPNFLLALMVMLFMTVQYGETLTGLFSPEYKDAAWSWARVLDLLRHIWLPIGILAWAATAIALQTVRALMSDEKDKLYVTAARARGVSGARLLLRYPAKHALGPVINSIGYDLNRIFNDLPIVATVLVLTEAGALLLEALASSNDQQVAGAIIFMITGCIVFLNFITDILLALIDPRVRRSMF